MVCGGARIAAPVEAGLAVSRRDLGADRTTRPGPAVGWDRHQSVSGSHLLDVRFDRVDDPVPADNFWGRIVDEALAGWLTSGNPLVVPGGGLSEVELVVDPYFPSTIPAIPESVRGRAAHPGVRNRLWMDGHADRLRDRRLR